MLKISRWIKVRIELTDKKTCWGWIYLKNELHTEYIFKIYFWVNRKKEKQKIWWTPLWEKGCPKNFKNEKGTQGCSFQNVSILIPIPIPWWVTPIPILLIHLYWYRYRYRYWYRYRSHTDTDTWYWWNTTCRVSKKFQNVCIVTAPTLTSTQPNFTTIEVGFDMNMTLDHHPGPGQHQPQNSWVVTSS